MRGWGRTIGTAALALGLLALRPGPGIAGDHLAPQWNELLPPHLDVLLRGFEPPPTPFAAGHRGLDIAVESGVTILVAPIDGTLSTGVAAGNRYATIQTPDDLRRVTLSYLSTVLVGSGAPVVAGDPIAIAGSGHGDGEVADPHVHLSMRTADITDPSGWRYLDPTPELRRYLRRVRHRITRIAV